MSRSSALHARGRNRTCFLYALVLSKGSAREELGAVGAAAAAGEASKIDSSGACLMYTVKRQYLFRRLSYAENSGCTKGRKGGREERRKGGKGEGGGV